MKGSLGFGGFAGDGRWSFGILGFGVGFWASGFET